MLHKVPSGLSLDRQLGSPRARAPCARSSKQAPVALARPTSAPRPRPPQAEKRESLSDQEQHYGQQATGPEQLAALALDGASALPGNFASPAINTVTSLWASYSRAVEQRPYRTKGLTSLVGFMLGDVLAQRIEGGGHGGLDVIRMIRLGAYGLAIDGPIGHAWYKLLDKYVEPKEPHSLKAVLLKTAADQLVWAPVMTCVYFAFLRAVEGHPELIQETINDKLVQTVVANYVVWPLAHFINFRFVPTEHRILYNNVVAIFWNAFLSTLSHTPTIDASGVIEGIAAAADQLSAATDVVITQVDIAVNSNYDTNMQPLHIIAQRVGQQIPEDLHIMAERFRAAFALSLHERADQFASALRQLDPKTVPVSPTRAYPGFALISSLEGLWRQICQPR